MFRKRNRNRNDKTSGRKRPRRKDVDSNPIEELENVILNCENKLDDEDINYMNPKVEDPFQLHSSKDSYDSAIFIDDVVPSHLDTTMPLENIHTWKTDHNIDSISNSYTTSSFFS